MAADSGPAPAEAVLTEYMNHYAGILAHRSLALLPPRGSPALQYQDSQMDRPGVKSDFVPD
jgi:hypothetical protein